MLHPAPRSSPELLFEGNDKGHVGGTEEVEKGKGVFVTGMYVSSADESEPAMEEEDIRRTVRIEHPF